MLFRTVDQTTRPLPHQQMRKSNDAVRFLESLHRFDLAKLLEPCQFEARKVRDYVWGGDSYRFVLAAPVPFSEALEALSPHDKKRVGEALAAADDESWAVLDASDFLVEPTGKVVGAAALIGELLVQRQVMIDVSTGGKTIQDVDDYYVAREARIAEFATGLGLPYVNPHASLWEWFHHWKASMPTYAERREYVRGLFKPALDFVAARTPKAPPARDPTGWERVDRALAKARETIEVAATEEDFQGVGLLCREVLISVAQAVYDPAIHEAEDGVVPSPTDAKRMIEGFLAKTVPGDSYKEVRAHARASWDLSVQLQHRRTANYQLAALCLEAASSTVQVISILAENRPRTA